MMAQEKNKRRFSVCLNCKYRIIRDSSKYFDLEDFCEKYHKTIFPIINQKKSCIWFKEVSSEEAKR